MDLGLSSPKSLMRGFYLPAFGYFILWTESVGTELLLFSIVHLIFASLSVSWLTIIVSKLRETDDMKMNEIMPWLSDNFISRNSMLSVGVVIVTFCSYVWSFGVYWDNIGLSRVIQLLLFIQALLLVRALTDTIYGARSDIEIR